MNKKLISALLGMSILFGTSSVVMAEGNITKITNEDKEAELTINGKVTPAIIDVEIPTTVEFQIDPFNIGKKGKIDTAVMTIENKSNVPVEIMMSKLKGTANGDLTLVDSPADLETEADTNKNAFLWIGQLAVTTDKSDPTEFTSVKPLAAYSETKNINQVVTSTEGSEVVSMGNLLEAAYEEGEYKTTNTKGKAYLGVIGDVTTVDDWSAEDGVEITATFTVTPKVVGSIK